MLRTREASFEDYDRIAAVHLRNGLSIRPYEDWVALWKGNPALPQGGNGGPIGWVLETSDGQVVGSISSIPVAYRFRGRNLRAAALSGWAVDVPYRAHSIWLLRQGYTQANADFCVSTTVSPATEAVLRLFKWAPAPVGKWNRSAFWITAYRKFMIAVLDAKSVPLSAVISNPLAAALYCADRLWDSGPGSNGWHCDAEPCSGFDERFDEFWQGLKSRYYDALLAVRSRESLAWHFQSALRRGSVWILAVHKGSRMIGYAIFDRLDNALLGLKRVRLVDFWALEKPQDLLRSALRWMLEKCRREEIHLLEIAGCWLDRPGFTGIRAPHHRSLASCMYYYRASDPGLKAALADRKVWFPSSFDGDASL